jgi:endonuclease YncB( thermonuclease family)
MANFKVNQIIDGDTFDVTPGWKWNNQTGDRVRPTGYDAPELDQPGGPAAKRKLEQLILGKQVELRNPATIDRGRLVCDVYFNGRKLADFFPEYRT